MQPKKTGMPKIRVSVAQINNDQDLLRLVLLQDPKAWNEFCRRYENLIVACVIKTLRRYGAFFSADDLADLVSEVWVTLLRDNMNKLRLFDPARGYQLTSWLGLIATNCTIDQLRVRNNGRVLFLDISWMEDSLIDQHRPDDLIEEQEAIELAQRAFQQLSVEEQQFLRDCYHEERKPEELAGELGIAINTVYSRKFKLREKLARLATDLEAPAFSTALAA